MCVCVCVCTRARNSSLHKHTHTCARIHSVFLLVRVCVCERAGVICFMMRRATCYTLTTIARSITWIFLSLNRHVDDRARAGEREREKRERRVETGKRKMKDSILQLEMNMASVRLYICFFFLLSLSFPTVPLAALFHFVSFSHLRHSVSILSSICSSLNVPSVNNIIQCIAADGQIGFVSNTDVEPLHIVSIAKPVTTPPTQSTMSNFFHRKTGELLALLAERCIVRLSIDTKKSMMKTKGRQLSKDMIGLPQADFIHAFHIGVSGQQRRQGGNGSMTQGYLF